MNILKIKLLLLSALCIAITSSNKSYAQNNFIDEPNGGIIKSDVGFTSKLSFHNSSNVYLGHLGTTHNAMSIHNKVQPVFYNKIGKYNMLSVGDARILHHSDGRVVITSTPGIVWDMLKDNNNNQITSYSLFVEKGILTEKCKVAVAGLEHWADYVFEEDYEMMDIEELEDYVTENKHLPNVPSAEEVVANGLDVAKMDAKLLEKIEEAYLYIIDLNKKVDALANENEGLKTSLESLSTSNK